MSTPRLAFRSDDGGRGYRHPITGEKVPSITTVIGALHKPALVPWAVKATAEKALRLLPELNASRDVPECKPRRVADECGECTPCVVKSIKRASDDERDYAAERGTRLHDYAEAWAKDDPLPPIADDLAPFVASLMAFLDDHKPEFTAIEATVWSYEHGYAGTLDFTALMGGVSTFGDYKTGKDVYPEVGMQIAAAVHADCVLGPDGTEYPIPSCDRAVAVSIRPRGYTVHEVTRLDESFQGFLGLLEAHRWKSAVAAEVLR